MARAKKKPESAATPYHDLKAQLDAIEERKAENRKKAQEAAKGFKTTEDALEEDAGPLRAALRNLEAEALAAAAPTLLTLVPEHDMRGCSDEDHNNYDEGCARCALLYILRYPHLACEFEVEISFKNRPYE